ncbi:MAG: hypothetical protein ABL921_12315 [Pirellula sp.]
MAVALIAAILCLLGRFEPVKQFDTQGYSDFPFNNLTNALNHQRTFAYPAFLKFFEVAKESNAIIPLAQFLIAIFSIAVFFATLLFLRWNAWLSLAAVLPILTCPMVLEYTSLLTPDLLAQSLGLLAVSFWLQIVYGRSTVVGLVGLSFSVFLAYQTKPSYLFLLGFIPIGGAIARWWLFSERKDSWWTGVQLALASVVPFIGWCYLRWIVVGHFGLVSFGGYNVIGVAGQLLERGSVDRFSASVQPLAKEILNRRDQKKNWERKFSYTTWESQFNPMVWEIAVPAAETLFDKDSRRMNFELSRLSREIIRDQLIGYLVWIALAAKHAFTECFELTIRNPMVLLSLGLMLFGHANNCKHRVGKSAVACVQRDGCQAPTMEYQTMVWLALGYAFCSLMLVILVEVPISRYCAPAAIFLSSVLGMLGVDMAFRNSRWMYSP